MKRAYVVDAKPGRVVVKWGKDWHGSDPDLVFAWREPADKRGLFIVMEAFERMKMGNERTFRQTLVDAGYDISTLKFSIQKLPGEST